MNNLKIYISKEAENQLHLLLENNKEYSCIRINIPPKCSKQNYELILDNFKPNYTIQKINNLFFIYDDSVCSYISSINIIHQNSHFMLKIDGINKSKNNKCECCSKCCTINKLTKED